MMKKYLRINETTLAVIILLVITVSFISIKSTSQFKCPDEYTSFDEQSADLDIFIKSFFKNNPSASLGDLAKARLKFYEENDCEKAIQRYKNAKNGDTDQLTSSEIEKGISEALSDNEFFSPFGFMFSYPIRHSAIEAPIDPAMIMVFSEKSPNTKAEEKSNAIIITTRENPPGTSAIDWLKGPSSGYDIKNGYKERLIGGQKAFLLYDKETDDYWALVDSPNGRWRTTISMLGAGKENEYLFEYIINSFLFE